MQSITYTSPQEGDFSASSSPSIAVLSKPSLRMTAAAVRCPSGAPPECFEFRSYEGPRTGTLTPSAPRAHQQRESIHDQTQDDPDLRQGHYILSELLRLFMVLEPRVCVEATPCTSQIRREKKPLPRTKCTQDFRTSILAATRWHAGCPSWWQVVQLQRCCGDVGLTRGWTPQAGWRLS